eukprot:gene401-3747_t
MSQKQLRLLVRRIKNAVVFQDRHVLIVNKWPGLVVQGSGDISLARVLHSLSDDEKDRTKENPSPLLQPSAKYSIVHRLDKETTGLILLAKHDKAQRILNDLFSSHIVEKSYVALTQGTPYPDCGDIDHPIISNKKESNMSHISNSKLRLERSPQGNYLDAKTSYNVLTNVEHHVALVHLRPLTGRRHQLRVHCAQILDTPILGDTKYGTSNITPWLHRAMLTPKQRQSQIPWRPKLHLHAYRIRIPTYLSHQCSQYL